MTAVYIGMGSNLGNSRQILNEALIAVRQHGTVDAVSALYVSAPLGPQDQPDFFNAALRLHTDLSPEALLDALQAIEQQAGRIKKRHWGERTLDLDILLYGDISMQSARLTIPHVGILARSFVILPLLDLDNTLVVAAQPLAQRILAIDNLGIERLEGVWVSELIE